MLLVPCTEDCEPWSNSDLKSSDQAFDKHALAQQQRNLLTFLPVAARCTFCWSPNSKGCSSSCILLLCSNNQQVSSSSVHECKCDIQIEVSANGMWNLLKCKVLVLVPGKCTNICSQLCIFVSNLVHKDLDVIKNLFFGAVCLCDVLHITRMLVLLLVRFLVGTGQCKRRNAIMMARFLRG